VPQKLPGLCECPAPAPADGSRTEWRKCGGAGLVSPAASTARPQPPSGSGWGRKCVGPVVRRRRRATADAAETPMPALGRSSRWNLSHRLKMPSGSPDLPALRQQGCRRSLPPFAITHHRFVSAEVQDRATPQARRLRSAANPTAIQQASHQRLHSIQSLQHGRTPPASGTTGRPWRLRGPHHPSSFQIAIQQVPGKESRSAAGWFWVSNSPAAPRPDD